ncbi:MAG: ribbon-helix-helix protein, CopG family [Gammaproteobacteria bacterium]|nr:ribbon-helix-helix protein, CopG family [Gammaproteobacteria bacterium]
MAKSRAEIQKKSDDKRGVTTKTYRLPKSLVLQIAELSKEHGISQGELIKRAIEQYANS